MDNELTDREYEVLGFIRECQIEYLFTPTTREISKAFGWRSANASQEVIAKLVRCGCVVKPRRNRIDITEHGLRQIEDWTGCAQIESAMNIAMRKWNKKADEFNQWCALSDYRKG